MIRHSPDADAFHAFERAGWESVADAYRHSFGDLTAQAVEPLLDAVGAGPGVRLLDVACGPGRLTSAAARRGATAIGLDFAAPMVESARRLHPGLEFRQGDAEELPYADASFDAVAMNFGLLHLARPERALGEACRVLRAAGRFAFTVWAPPERALAFGFVLDAVREQGNPNVPLPPGPPFFRFSDPDEARRALLAAGFRGPRVEGVPMTWRVPSPEALFEAMAQATVRTRGLLRAQEPAALDRIRRAVCAAAEGYSRDGAVALPMPCVLASAAKG